MNKRERVFAVRDYDLAATLDSGQSFRWRRNETGWTGIVGRRWVHIESRDNTLLARVAGPADGWTWLEHYLQVNVELGPLLASFPDDEAMRSSVGACRGLRLLRQDPWECLASFILSSTKQIVQIRQIVTLLCERFGEPVNVPKGHPPEWSFPCPARLAAASEHELRDCKMGFRAPYLLGTARAFTEGAFDPDRLRGMELAQARGELVKLPGVGRKVADCALLFAYGYPTAFPVDVWILKALRQLYFPRRNPKAPRLQRFTETYFGPNAGYAQQYLFHYMRTRERNGSEKNRKNGVDSIRKKSLK